MNEKPLPHRFSCPLPELDFDTITLGHGSGGALTHALLDKAVFAVLDEFMPAEKRDGVTLHMEGRVAFSTDSFIVSPLFFPGGDIGDLAVNGTANDLAMCGATPQYLSLSFIIEEGFSMDEFWRVIHSVKRACKKAGVKIVTGDTKVVEKGKGDKLFINTSGVGTVLPQADLNYRRIGVGDKVLVSGPVAAHGMAIMSVREGLTFDADLVSDTAPVHEVTEALIKKFGKALHLLTDPTRGGVATVLKDVAETTGLCIRLRQDAIPISEPVADACELLGLDPLYVANEGLFICIIDAAVAQDCLALIQGHPRGSGDAAIIGTVTDTHPGQVILQTPIGGQRSIGMLPGEQLPRIC